MTYTWAFQPQQLPTEVLEWKTDVIRAKGQEQRICLREAPRQGYSYDYVWNAQQLARASLFIQARGDEEIYLPIWTEFTEVSSLSSGATTITFDTTNAHYQVGGYVIVWGDESTYDVREILTLDDTYLTVTAIDNDYSPALVMPVKTAIFASPLQVNRLANSHSQASVEFISTDSWKLADAGEGEITDDAITALSVANHDFETGDLTGWTSVIGDWEARDVQTSPSGGYHAMPFTTTLCELMQSISLTSTGVTTAALDTGNAILRVEWEQGCSNGYHSADSGYIKIVFKDGGASTLSTETSTNYMPAFTSGVETWVWENMLHEVVIPSTARTAEISFMAQYLYGLNNNSSWDNLRVSVLETGSIVYRGYNVMIDCIVVNGTLSESYSEEVDTFDSESGLIWVGNAFNYPAKMTLINRHLGNKADAWAFREWMHTRRGRWKEFFLPSYNNDFEIVTPITSTDTAITVTEIGYTDHVTDQHDLMIRKADGENLYFRIVGSSNAVPGYEVIGLDREVGENLALADISFCCFLVRSRFNSDRVEINHLHAGESEVSIPVTHVPEYVPVYEEPEDPPAPQITGTGIEAVGRYWYYDNAPVLLAGGFNTGEPHLYEQQYSANGITLSDTSDFLGTELAKLVAAGGNYIRCTLANWQTPYATGDIVNVYPFSGYPDAFDLTAINDDWVDRVNALLYRCEALDVVVQLECFDTWWNIRNQEIYDGDGTISPHYASFEFNPDNVTSPANYTLANTGLPATYDSDNDTFTAPALANDTTNPLLIAQKIYIDAICSIVNNHNNVLLQIQNESPEDTDWADFWTAYIRSKGVTAPITTMQSGHDINSDTDAQWAMSHSWYQFGDSSQQHWTTTDIDNLFSDLITFQNVGLKPVNAIKIYENPQGNVGVSLDKFFMSIMAGNAGVAFHPGDGTATYYGLGITSYAQEAMEAARWLDNNCDLAAMGYVSLSSSQWGSRPSGGAWACQNSSYIAIYINSGTSFTFNTTSLGATMEMRWKSVEDGDLSGSGTTATSTTTSISNPFGSERSLLIMTAV